MSPAREGSLSSLPEGDLRQENAGECVNCKRLLQPRRKMNPHLMTMSPLLMLSIETKEQSRMNRGIPLIHQWKRWSLHIDVYQYHDPKNRLKSLRTVQECGGVLFTTYSLLSNHLEYFQKCYD